MAIITVVAGAYTGQYTPGTLAGGGAAGPVGILADAGWRLSWTLHTQALGNDGTDQFGQTLLTHIMRGADWKMAFRAREYSELVMKMAWPGRSGPNADFDDSLAPYLSSASAGSVGYDMWESGAGVLALTSTAGTPAAANPVSLTAGKAVASPGSHSVLELTSRQREVDVMLDLLLYSVTINTVAYNLWFVAL